MPGDGHLLPSLCSRGKMEMLIPSFQRYKSPIPRWLWGGDRDISTDSGQRAAGLHYPAQQPQLIPLSVYTGEGESGHRSQGTWESPNFLSPQILPRPPGDGRDLVFGSVLMCGRKDAGPAGEISGASPFVLPRQKVTLLFLQFPLKSWRVLGRGTCGFGMKQGCSAPGVLLPVVPRAVPGAEFGCDYPKVCLLLHDMPLR